MEPSIDEQIKALEKEIEECQKVVRDESKDKRTRDKARAKIQEDWYKISELRRTNQSGGKTDEEK